MCPYLGESTVGGSTVTVTDRRGCYEVSVPEEIVRLERMLDYCMRVGSIEHYHFNECYRICTL